MNHKNIILCGLPASGKTTFIAALWYLIYQEEVSTVLSLNEFPKNREYLNEISGKWCRCDEIPRTLTEVVQTVSLQLKADTAIVDLHIPDLSGETWKALWCNRVCPAHAFEWVKDASGIMLFLHSDDIVPPVEITDRTAMSEIAGEDPVDSEFIPWDPEKSPTQVILVDILQSLTTLPIGRSGVKLSVVISAWDLVDGDGDRMTPDKYLKDNLPLLNQFLNCSGKFSEVRFFGVSAQGGDLRSPLDQERLQAEDEASKRIEVVGDNCGQHDITAPIKWLIE